MASRTNCRYGGNCYRETYKHKKDFAHPGDCDYICDYICPCGGGQSCIVDRRLAGDWVHEDQVFREAGLDVRLDCMTEWNAVQQRAMRRVMRGFNSVCK